MWERNGLDLEGKGLYHLLGGLGVMWERNGLDLGGKSYPHLHFSLFLVTTAFSPAMT